MPVLQAPCWPSGASYQPQAKQARTRSRHSSAGHKYFQQNAAAGDPAVRSSVADPSAYLVSSLNSGIEPAKPNEFQPLKIASSLSVYPPILLAPMAGLTNSPFRRLCASFGAPMCVSEMVIAHTLVKQNASTLKLVEFSPDESLRSVQLYGTRPASVEQVKLRDNYMPCPNG